MQDDLQYYITFDVQTIFGGKKQSFWTGRLPKLEFDTKDQVLSWILTHQTPLVGLPTVNLEKQPQKGGGFSIFHSP